LGLLPIHTYIKPAYVALINAIIGQKIQINQARNIRSRLYALLTNNFTVYDIERLTDQQLLETGVDEKKLNIIRNTNKYLLENNNELDTAAKIRSLTKINGIGEWTVINVLLATLKDLDVIPATDKFLQKRIQELYSLPTVPTRREVLQLSEKWKPYRGIVTWYFWRWE